VSNPVGTYGEIHLNGDGTYSYTLTSPVTSSPSANDGANTEIRESFTYLVTDAAGQTAQSTISVHIVDDVPTITTDNIAIPNIADTYEGTYNFDVGADTQAFSASIGDGNLSWTDITQGDGFSLVYYGAGSNPSAQVYNGTFNNGADTFFTITVNSDSTYLFNLVEPKPVVESPLIDILQGVDGGSNLPEYSFGSATFGGYFDLVAKGYENGNLSTLTISSTDLGVGDNVIQENSNDVLRFDLNPTLSGIDNNVTVSEFTVSLADTASIKDGTLVELSVHYTDSSVVNMTDAYFKANGGDLVFELDPLKTVDYFELYNYAGDSKDYSFKIDEVGLKYSTTTYPDDYKLHFSLTGSDADGDHATADFTVAVNTSSATGYEIKGTLGIDSLYGTAGNDILAGGAGADTFKVSDGQDHITDYSQAEGDKIEIAAGDSYSKVLDDNGYAKLVITDGAIEKSITFDTISYNTLDTTHGEQALLDSLLDKVNHN
jgi:VCBS repeat-containing protein